MAFDLSKLTPAPWECHLGAGGGGGWFPYVEERNSRIVALTDAEFIALARKAFDVMMRRGWHPVLLGDVGPWMVDADGYGWIECSRADNPFTSLVEADKWYREHVEAAKS